MSQPLISVGPGGPMESGLASARHPESVEFWHDGESVAFRDLGVEKALGSEEFLPLGFSPLRLAQAWVNGVRRLYFQDQQFRVWGWDEGAIAPFYISTLAALASLEPFGNWLFSADGTTLRLWQGSGGLAGISGSPTGAKLLAKLKDHLLVANDDSLSWGDIKDPTNYAIDSPSTSRTLRFRNLESPLLALKPLGDGLALYTSDSLRKVNYRGAAVWFGENGTSLDGIGALGPNSIVSAGFKNYGLTRNGIFVTDGSSFQFIDTPQFHGYLEPLVDWDRADEIFSWHNESFQQVEFYCPSLSGDPLAIAYKYTNGSFSKPKLPILAAIDREVFPFPIFGTSSGLSYGKGRTTQPALLRTKPLDAGDSLSLKLFEYYRFVGKWGGNARFRLGLSNTVNTDQTQAPSAPFWFYDGPLVSETFFQQEGAFLTIEFYTDSDGWFELSQILVSGELGGHLF